MEQPSRTKPRRSWLPRIIMPVLGYVVVVLALAWFFEQRATTTVIFVTHAETDATTASDDPGLSARGRQRAELLADFLQDVNVSRSVDNIYAHTTRRTQETAAPLARRLGLTLHIDDPYRVERFMRRVMRDRKGEVVLIVTYADAIAPLIDELHGSKRLPPLAPDDFDEVYIVTIPNFGKVKTLRFHYPSPPSDARLSESATTFSLQ
jgi:broad specificity phosphatase PhoE